MDQISQVFFAAPLTMSTRFCVEPNLATCQLSSRPIRLHYQSHHRQDTRPRSTAVIGRPRRRGDRMRRREFIAVLGGTTARSVVARAQPTGMMRIDRLMSAAETNPEETFSDGYRKSSIISRKAIGTCRLTPEEFHTAYPKLRAWIQKTLEFYEENAKPVASMHFVRLPLYFDQSLLDTAKFIAIDRLPMPPLSAMGLSRFAVFEQGDFNGITYLDRYFIKQTVVTEEAIHFHVVAHLCGQTWRRRA